LRKADPVETKGDNVNPRRLRLQLRLLMAVVRAARPHERQGVVERGSAILENVAIEIHPEEDRELAKLLDAVRAEMQEALRKG
jgi:hypothetical protein